MSSTQHRFFEIANKAFQAGVSAADPYKAVVRFLPDFDQQPLVLSIGKAAVAMARGASDVLGGLHNAIVVTNPENAENVPGATVFAASHPVPDEIGISAGRAVISAIQSSSKSRPILCLISGGGSALLPAPAGDLGLSDKARVNELLLASGADIVTMNMIRQQLSDLKGGGILRYAEGRRVTSLVLSDVIGDDLRAIASGPTVAPIGTPETAKSALHDLGVWTELPTAVQNHLRMAKRTITDNEATNILIGSNSISLQAMADMMPNAEHHKTPLEGNVIDAAQWVAAQSSGRHVFGGETTVTLKGSGRGGRNQDLALRLALLAEANDWQGPWLYLQAGTDGRDGPTDAAGGVVTERTLSNIRAKGLDPQALLDNNDAYPALEAADALLLTGGTGTNVADLGVLIRS